ncbi:MAG: riboflavin synthase [Proteobacteria bacterium]|nr:riboflavin synthase [Pseudomonadota bacterium]
MFTGIIEALGTIARIETASSSARISIASKQLDLNDVKLGDSIAVSGPCLTVVEFSSEVFVVDVSSETLAKTTIGKKKIGDSVNLEKAMRLSDRLGGHIVSGHVDGVGSVIERTKLDGYVKFKIQSPIELAKYIAAKGSVCVDGISLTVNAVEGATFELMIIPHTLKETTLGDARPGHEVNLEIDIVARYLEQLLVNSNPQLTENLSMEMLKRAGFE